MDLETRSHIFEPFFTTKELGKGTGLGLSPFTVSLSKRGLYLGRQPAGTRNGLSNLLSPRRKGNRPSRKATPFADLFQGSETILIVEDNELVRNLTSEALRQFGIVSLKLRERPRLKNHSGKMEEDRPLLTDVVMPGLNGPRVGRSSPFLPAGIKVLYMSGIRDNAIVQHGILSPGLAFIEKPFLGDLSRKSSPRVTFSSSPTNPHSIARGATTSTNLLVV